jgi:hypothetical protein
MPPNVRSGVRMTLKPCRNGYQLSLLMNCGAVCDEWPDCLPTPSPDALAKVTRFCADGAAAGQNSEAVASALSRLHEAITRGLEGRKQ